MVSKKLYLLTLMFVGVSIVASEGGAVEIEEVDSLPQGISLTCGAHAFKNAKLGLELIRARGNADEEAAIKERMSSSNEYEQCTGFMDKKSWLNGSEIQAYIDSQGLSNVFRFDTKFVNKTDDLNTFFFYKDLFRELVEPTYVKSFIISTGGYHSIACTIEKVDGVVERVIGMNSSKTIFSKILTWIGQKIKKGWLSEQEAIQKVVDFASDPELVEQVQLYDRYQRCLKMAQCMANSFYVTSFAYDYIGTEYEEGQQLSQDLVDDFGRRFRDFVQTISMDEGGDNMISDKDHARRLTRVSFLETFLPGSSWWTDASLFSDENSAPGFTEEERAEMIELMNIDELLAEARGTDEQEEEPSEEPLEEPDAVESSDSGSEERSTEEAKGEDE